MERLKLVIIIYLWQVLFLSGCSHAKLVCDATLIDTTLATLYAEKDTAKAKAMVEPCAKAGDSASQIAMSLVYDDLLDAAGLRDIDNSLLWSERATHGANIVAIYKHALTIDVIGRKTGRGALETMLWSLDWYLKAAEGGHPHALYEIGSKLKRYSTDEVIAYTFLVLAVRRVDATFDYYNFITSDINEMELFKLSDEDIGEAIALADLWERNHPDAAKSWPSGSWVANMKGEESKEIPELTSAPTNKSFCDIFGQVMIYCPQESKISESEKRARRPDYVKKH